MENRFLDVVRYLEDINEYELTDRALYSSVYTERLKLDKDGILRYLSKFNELNCEIIIVECDGGLSIMLIYPRCVYWDRIIQIKKIKIT